MPDTSGTGLSIEVLIEGEPTLTCEGDDNSLINVDVRDLEVEYRRTTRRLRFLLSGGLWLASP